MNKPYEFSINASAAARSGYEKASPAGASFDGFRKIAKSINISLVGNRADIEQRKTENRENLSVKLAGEKNKELEDGFKTVVADKQQFLRRAKGKLIASNKDAITQHTTQPPTAEQLRLIDSVSRRVDSMTDAEWEMIVAKIAEGGNYQAAALLHDIATQHNKQYTLPFEPDKAIQKLNVIDSQLETLINHIDRDPVADGLGEIAQFYAHEPGGAVYGVLNMYCDEFDSELPSFTPESIADITDPADVTARLLECRSIAYRNNNKAIFNDIVHIDMDIERNGLNDDNLNRAEQLINYVRVLYPDVKSDDNG